LDIQTISSGTGNENQNSGPCSKNIINHILTTRRKTMKNKKKRKSILTSIRNKIINTMLENYKYKNKRFFDYKGMPDNSGKHLIYFKKGLFWKGPVEVELKQRLENNICYVNENGNRIWVPINKIKILGVLIEENVDNV
jgi:hypothetical protein